MRVNTFQWGDFYTQFGGGIYLEAVKAQLRADYDFILIDSRTGLSDTSGICTVQMPDDLVVCFTLNRQSIHGAAATATSADVQRRRADGTPGLNLAGPHAGRAPRNGPSRDRATGRAGTVRGVSLAYPVGAANGILGPIGSALLPVLRLRGNSGHDDAPQNTVSLLSSMEHLTARLQNTVRQMPDLSSTVRVALRTRYESAQTLPKTTGPRRPRFYISHARVDDAGDFVAKLIDEINQSFGVWCRFL